MIPQRLSFIDGNLDRGDGLRRDEDALTKLQTHGDTRIIPFWHNQVFINGLEGTSPTLKQCCGEEAVGIIESASEILFLGLNEGRALFAADLSHLEESAARQQAIGATLIGLRQGGVLLNPAEGAVIAYAGSLLHWHRHNRYCGSCGEKTEHRQGGRARCCTHPACRREAYPRSDPAVIMLVEHRPTDGSPSRCLLGRHSHLPTGMYSTLAGFVEPGETLEQAVTREVFEETGIHIKKANYLASQPWPFPSSLMVGFLAEATTTEITLDLEELEDARWFSREEVMQISRDDQEPGAETLRLPGRDSIAHRLLDTWLTNL